MKTLLLFLFVGLTLVSCKDKEKKLLFIEHGEQGIDRNDSTTQAEYKTIIDTLINRGWPEDKIISLEQNTILFIGDTGPNTPRNKKSERRFANLLRKNLK